MNTNRIRSVISNRSIITEVKSNGNAWLGIEGSDGVNGYITISKRGKLELIEQLAALAPDVRFTKHHGEAVAAGALTDDQLSRRLIATAQAMQIRMTEAEEAYVAKVAAEVKAKAEATLAAEEAAKLQAILDRRPAPGIYKLTTLGGTQPGHTIVTEDRTIHVATFRASLTGNYKDVTETADRVDTWTFTKVPLTPALINDAFPLVEDLTTWLQLATK